MMQKIRTTLLVLLVLAGSGMAFGQHALLLDAGQNRTNFKYTDDNDERDTSYNPQFSTSFHIGYAYSLKEGVYFQTRIGMRQAGASYVYDEYNYRWEIDYGEYRLGVGYKYDFKKLYAKFLSEGYVAYAFSASQRLYNVDRDMIQAGTLNRLDYGLFLAPGAGYGLTENINLELDINYMFGFGNLDMDEGQTTQNDLWGVNLGLNINL